MSEIMNQFRDEELPASTVDVSRAVQAGRRQRRIRTGFAAGGVALALAVGGATAPAWLSSQFDSTPPAEPPCGSPEPARASMPTWHQFDPTVLEIDASNVAGYYLAHSASSTNFQTVVLEKEDSDPETSDVGAVYVMLYACGVEPPAHDPGSGQLMPFDPSTGEPAGSIGTAPAYWLRDGELPDRARNGGLAWQWASGAWVIVYAETNAMAVPAAMEVLQSAAAEVAHQLELGVGAAVTSPFSMPLPAGTYPAITATNWAKDAGELFAVGFSIGFDAIGKAAPAQQFTSDYMPSLLVSALTFTSVDDRPADTTEYPEDLGYPAYQTTDPSDEREIDLLLIYDVAGFSFQVSASEVPGASTRDERLGLTAAVFRTITVYPDAAAGVASWGEPLTP